MSKITVYRYTYYDAEQGIRMRGNGMCTEEAILSMKNDPQIIRSETKEINESELTQSGRYYDQDGAK